MIADQSSQQHRQGRFGVPRGFLHQNAVHKFTDPVLVLQNPKEVFLGGFSGWGPGADAAGVDAAELLQHLGDVGKRDGSSRHRRTSGE